jgi:hypothetical protein
MKRANPPNHAPFTLVAAKMRRSIEYKKAKIMLENSTLALEALREIEQLLEGRSFDQALKVVRHTLATVDNSHGRD